MRCLLFGLGATGIWVARFLSRNGATIVAAHSRSTHVGRDLADVIGEGRRGVMVTPAAQAAITPGCAEIAVFCTTGHPQDLMAEARACLLAGVNVVTLAEGAFYPWTWQPDTARALDRAALDGGATLCASGFQDAVMTHLVATLAASVPSTSRIAFHVCNDFTHLGAGSARRLQLGLRPEDFDPQISSRLQDGEGPPMSTIGQCIESLAAMLGLGTPGLKFPGLVPVVAAADIAWPHLRIPAGRVAGMCETVLGTTPEGIVIEGRMTAKIFEPGDRDLFSCEIGGDYPTALSVSPTYGAEGTAATLVNRIPDVIAAAPGFMTVDRLPAPRLRPASAYI